MADELKIKYEQHVRDTAPDMDMLWSRIESGIDAKENGTENNKSYEIKRKQITTKRFFTGISAAAAAIVITVVGVNMLSNSEPPKSDKFFADNEKVTQAADTAENADIAENTDNAEAFENSDMLTVEEGEDIKNAEEGIAAEDNAMSPQSDDYFDEEAEEYTDTAKSSASSATSGASAYSDAAANAEDLTVRYSSLAFNDTDTQSYSSSYTPDGDEYFVESKVLANTDCFADVTVQSADLQADGAVYTLEVNNVYNKNGEELDSYELTITSKTPYILQQNREYLLPLRYESGKWYIVFENAPQIEITLDGGAVFQNGWSELDDDIIVVKDSTDTSDFYYDRMRYCEEADLEKLIETWKNI